ncbi:hypothetical protein CRV08_01035 [Halarcobacter ebronensis]|uniref:histidine kinase n=1 Tax=Halarcobacter ebronensis TaxID=1462615 RepID=A0A4Q0YHP7_9BACT|nr:hypothetical protein CRV08_01035 [Halarcobacter ebronensis]
MEIYLHYPNIHKFKLVVAIAFCLYILVIYLVYQDNKKSEIDNEITNIEDVLIQIQAIRKYVGDDQKDEIDKLQAADKISYDYFTPALLSSTYSANKINDYYNEIRKEKNLPTTDIRFASPNPRNPHNLVTKEEKKILNAFLDKKIKRYEEIKKGENGDILYVALPTKELEAKCMKCHSTPEAAPKQLVELYGNKAGFGEQEGNMKAILSIKKPLDNAYIKAFDQTLKTAIYILIATFIFVYFYYNYNKKIYIKNLELERLNRSLDNKVKERTEELNNSKMQLLNVINSSELGYWDWNKNTNWLQVNDKWLNMLGLKREEFSNSIKDWFDKIHPKDLEFVVSKIEKDLEDDISFSIEYRVLNKKNEYIWVECVGGTVQKDFDGKVIQACGILRNIHQKKLNEEKVQEQEILIHNQAKVSAISEMLKNISHQWKQPLSAITTLASAIKLSYELKQDISKEEIIKYTDKILENGNYLAKIVNDFSSYFENNSQKRENSNLSNSFVKIREIFKESRKSENIKCHTNIEENIITYTNENFFMQAMLNIFNNSLDAFIKNNIDKDYRYIFIDVKVIDNTIVIIFKDSAGGISNEIISKIFEPYFTTKHQSLGTGLGLYITNQIINKHLNGVIDVKNSNYIFEGKELNGIEFKIIIPKVEK